MAENVSTIKLKKVLGVVFGISIVVGSTIGAGILRTPGSIAGLLPNKFLILSCWLLTGFYILLSASSYAELTTMMPKAGGAFNYIKRAFGNYMGFTTGWFDFILNIGAPSFFCIVLGEYTGLLFPVLQGHNKMIGVGYLTLFTLLNLPGIKSGSNTQKITSILKVVLLLVLVIGCFFAKPQQNHGMPVTKTLRQCN
jgi:APA family basic amino acid/polyamine antiporter